MALWVSGWQHEVVSETTNVAPLADARAEHAVVRLFHRHRSRAPDDPPDLVEAAPCEADGGEWEDDDDEATSFDLLKPPDPPSTVAPASGASSKASGAFAGAAALPCTVETELSWQLNSVCLPCAHGVHRAQAVWG